jgi:hypothetical protein
MWDKEERNILYSSEVSRLYNIGYKKKFFINLFHLFHLSVLYILF